MFHFLFDIFVYWFADRAKRKQDAKLAKLVDSEEALAETQKTQSKRSRSLWFIALEAALVVVAFSLVALAMTLALS